MTAFGTSAWGTSGFGLTPNLTVVNAYASSTRTVIVDLSKPPQAINTLLPNDVLNPASWLITRVDTGEAVQIARVEPYNAPLRWLITTLSQLPESTALVRVTAIGIRDAAGNFVQAPRSADFYGVTELALSTPTQKSISNGSAYRDISNIPAPTLAQDSIGGTLQIKGGDYTLDSGVELVKKLIIRRLTTTPGDFFHLPNYGCGLRVKQIIPTGDLIKLKTFVTNQILLEPDVESCSVGITQSANLLIVQVRALMRSTGEEVNVAINSNIGSVRL